MDYAIASLNPTAAQPPNLKSKAKPRQKKQATRVKTGVPATAHRLRAGGGIPQQR
jgi:hypothetical protein